MTFFNRRLLAFAAIVLAATLFMYLAVWKAGTPSWVLGTGSLAYAALIAVSALLLSRNDPYQYFGFNYHLITYFICLAVPLGLMKAHLVAELSFVGTMAINWGIGVLIHLIVFLVMARKRRIRGYDKGEIFR